MKVTIELPEDVSAALKGRWDDVPRRSLEAIAVEGYYYPESSDPSSFVIGGPGVVEPSSKTSVLVPSAPMTSIVILGRSPRSIVHRRS